MNEHDPTRTTTEKWEPNEGEHAARLSDRDLLFARLAVVNGFVGQETLDKVKQSTDPNQSLGKVLVENGTIADEDRQAIEQLLERHLAKHNDDPEVSLSTLSMARTISFARQPDRETFVTKTKAAPADFDDYEILEEIARGGMGVVFRAKQISLNRQVALKMIRSPQLAGPDDVRRFQAEAESAAKLNHPGIVPIYEVGHHGDRHFFSMGLVEGGTLSKLVNDGPVDSKQAARLVETIAEAVQYAHARNIVHRDLKPANVLLDVEGRPKVSDFGLAKNIEEDSGLTATGTIMGTPAYMAPEQAAGKLDEVGPLADVYALGGILYFLLTGKPPFEGKTHIEIIQQVINDEPKSPRQINPQLDRSLATICLKCLHKDLSRRYASAGELADELQRWFENKPILARPVGVWERGWLWCRRRPAIAGSIAAVLMIGIIASFIVLVVRQRNLAERLHTAVASLNTSRGIILPPLKDLDKFPSEMVLAKLHEQFETADELRKLPLVFAMAHFDDVRIEFLLSRVENVSPDELDNLVTALSKSKTESLLALEAAVQAADSEKKWRHKSRLAMLALHLNVPAFAEDMCQLRPDPIQRTLFIEECSTWHGNLTLLAQIVEDTDDAPLRSAVALTAGSVPIADITASEKQEWESLLSTWYQKMPDTGTHSAADWSLRKWELKLPEIAVSKQPTDNRNWHENSVGLTMLKIPTGSFVRKELRLDHPFEQQVSMTRRFLLSNREISRAQFQQFVDDPDYPKEEKPKGQHDAMVGNSQFPLSEVSWYDAVLFCNWLSNREGLGVVYERTGKKEGVSAAEYDAWRVIAKADGYRLPTEAEWEYACRAGTVTAYSHGDDESLLDRYAVYRWNRAELPGSKLPNGWGLFDAHGNVWEWCQDRYQDYQPFGSEKSVSDPMGYTQDHLRTRVLRGGSFSILSGDLKSGRRHNYPPQESGRHSYFGFRVARTLAP